MATKLVSKTDNNNVNKNDINNKGKKFRENIV